MTFGLILVAAAAAIWGTLGIVATGLNQAGFTGFDVAALRVVFSAVALAAAAPVLLRHDLGELRRHAPVLIIHAFIGVFVYNATYFLAVAEAGVTVAVGLLYTAPIWAIVFGAILLGERPTRLRIALALAACGGVALTLGGPGAARAPSIAGIGFGLAAGASYALYTVIGKKAVTDLNPTAVLFSSFLVGGAFFLAVPASWQALGRLGALEPPAVAEVWGSLLAISLVGTIFSYFLFTRGIRRVPAASAAVVTTAEPLVAVALAAALLGETLTPLHYAGIGLIVFCGVASSVSGTRDRRVTPPA